MFTKIASTAFVVVMMDEIKQSPLCVIVAKLNPRNPIRKTSITAFFSNMQAFGSFCMSAVFVLHILGVELPIFTFLKGLNSNSSGGKTAILQLSDCVIWAFKKPGPELVYCQTHSPEREKDLFPPCLCVTSPSEIILCSQCLNDNHISSRH